MPKITIYIPQELHEDMEKINTNWSAVAQQAFRRVCDGNLERIKAMLWKDVPLDADKAKAMEATAVVMSHYLQTAIHYINSGNTALAILIIQDVIKNIEAPKA